ncbi:hypothetical protein BDV95DRAFT_592233 [Massariosphaeria phaeospora]|uniref:Uncharacterized protein n=1 Tax=Massariosphaeria phaeospora TaxID=100035 RepID=A0A7C8IJ34_9PLEO|nr:hypothetical protein BDV95DRAFT_592233 [Massariosphaeria phaeospora]
MFPTTRSTAGCTYNASECSRTKCDVAACIVARYLPPTSAYYNAMGLFELDQLNRGDNKYNQSSDCGKCGHKLNDRASHPHGELSHTCTNQCFICKRVHDEILCPDIYASKGWFVRYMHYPSATELPAYLQVRPSEVEEGILKNVSFIEAWSHYDKHSAPVFTSQALQLRRELVMLSGLECNQRSYTFDRMQTFRERKRRSNTAVSGDRHPNRTGKVSHNSSTSGGPHHQPASNRSSLSLKPYQTYAPSLVPSQPFQSYQSYPPGPPSQLYPPYTYDPYQSYHPYHPGPPRQIFQSYLTGPPQQPHQLYPPTPPYSYGQPPYPYEFPHHYTQYPPPNAIPPPQVPPCTAPPLPRGHNESMPYLVPPSASGPLQTPSTAPVQPLIGKKRPANDAPFERMSRKQRTKYNSQVDEAHSSTDDFSIKGKARPDP